MSRKSEYNNYEVENVFEPISIDGKSWAYRDPNNTEKIEFDSRGDDNYDGFMNTGSGNRDSFAFTNPLYKFSQGEVERTARSLGINTNIDEPEEVEKILAKLNGSFETKEDSDTEAEVDPTPQPIELPSDPQNEQRVADAQADYDENFANGADPKAPTSATESYNKSFETAKAAGQDWDIGWYLRQRADDKKAGVSRYTNMLTDRNNLTMAENHNSMMNAIEMANRLGLKPSDYNDPKDTFDYYADQINDFA